MPKVNLQRHIADEQTTDDKRKPVAQPDTFGLTPGGLRRHTRIRDFFEQVLHSRVGYRSARRCKVVKLYGNHASKPTPKLHDYRCGVPLQILREIDV